MKNLATMGSSVSFDENDEDQASKLAFASYQAREEEIEKRKMMVKEKVEMKLGRAEEETRRLAQVWEVRPQNRIQKSLVFLCKHSFLKNWKLNGRFCKIDAGIICLRQHLQ